MLSFIKCFAQYPTSIQPPRNLKHLSGSKAQALSGRQGIRYLIAAPYRCLACPRKSTRLRARTLCLSMPLYHTIYLPFNQFLYHCTFDKPRAII
jgi:hypothetical protein